jgi:TetR/AcrR family transcriptional repressor of nem operon
MFKVERMRRSVVVEAAAAIRETGPDRVSVSGLIGPAHLSHGEFNLHFASKDALVAEAVTSGSTR